MLLGAQCIHVAAVSKNLSTDSRTWEQFVCSIEESDSSFVNPGDVAAVQEALKGFKGLKLRRTKPGQTSLLQALLQKQKQLISEFKEKY